MITTSVA